MVPFTFVAERPLETGGKQTKTEDGKTIFGGTPKAQDSRRKATSAKMQQLSEEQHADAP